MSSFTFATSDTVVLENFRVVMCQCSFHNHTLFYSIVSFHSLFLSVCVSLSHSLSQSLFLSAYNLMAVASAICPDKAQQRPPALAENSHQCCAPPSHHNTFSLMLDLHYDTLLSDGISGWAVAQGKRGKRLCSPCPLVPQRVRESGRVEAGRSPCAGRCSGAGLWKTTTEAEMVEESGFNCLMNIVSMYTCCCAKTTAFGLAHLHMLTCIIF